MSRDRDALGRPRSARRRDPLGRPLPRTGDEPPLPAEPPAPEPAVALARAQRLLDVGRAFEAHEVMESVWKATPAPGRELWRGLAQLAVGVTHHARGNPRGAGQLLRRGARSMAPFAGTRPDGVAVDDLRGWAEAAAAAAADGEPLPSMPRLQRAGPAGPAAP